MSMHKIKNIPECSTEFSERMFPSSSISVYFLIRETVLGLSCQTYCEVFLFLIYAAVFNKELFKDSVRTHFWLILWNQTSSKCSVHISSHSIKHRERKVGLDFVWGSLMTFLLHNTYISLKQKIVIWFWGIWICLGSEKHTDSLQLQKHSPWEFCTALRYVLNFAHWHK